ncbi:Kinesin-like protein kif21b [Podila minutissima]|nr:Kinesin-like protein kif21b [Podila minutissima]
MNTAVKVALRVRPLTLQEQINNCSECISYVPNEPQIGIVGSDKSFTFDHVFDEESTQKKVYEECAKELVERFIEGFNVTILAYGQTGSGKTYSMGTGLQYQGNTDQAIVPRAAHAIFSNLNDQKEQDTTLEFQVFVSFLELYNEELIDLLQTQPRTRKETIQVREDGFGGISWQGVKEHQVQSAQELLDWLQKGSLCRTTASTDMNQTSSRSHAIFSVILKQQRAEVVEEIPEGEEAPPPVVHTNSRGSNDKALKKLTSKFHFVDLAGSERLKRTRAVGDRAKEGISINSGLLALGNVISALGDEARKSSHVPYRDSKLTRLLQDSLGGNSATLMLACVSGADVDYNETISTLVYANRARNIRNRVVINQDFRDSTNSEIAGLRAEINRLKMENSSFRAMGSGPAAELDQRRAAEEMRSLRGEVSRLRDRLRENATELCDVLAERDTLLVEREVTGDADIEAHPIMMTYHHTVMQLKDRLIAAEDQALELQTLLSSKQTSSVFGRRAGSNRNGSPPYRRRIEPMTDDDHDADGETDGQIHRRKEASPPRGRASPHSKRNRRLNSSRAVSRFDFGTTAASIVSEPAQMPTSPPLPQVEQLLSAGGASSWFQSLKTEENQPLSAHALDYSSTSSGSLLQARLPLDSDSSSSFSARRRMGRHGSGVAETLDKAKEDIRRGLLLLKAEKNGMGMDMDLINFLDPSVPIQLRNSSTSSRRRGSITSSLSSGSSRSRFPPVDDLMGGNPMSNLRSSFPFPVPSPSSSFKDSSSPKDQSVFMEAEQKAAETLANAMKAMNRFSFPLSAADTQQRESHMQQSQLTAALDKEKMAANTIAEESEGQEGGDDVVSVAAPSTKSSASKAVSAASAASAAKSAEKPNYELMLSEVQSGIAIKEELVQQLEKAEAEYHHMRNQYEEEIRMMEEHIREAEMERERERNLNNDVSGKYETKIKQLMAELSDLQHKYAEVSKIANEKRSLAEGQLRTLRVAVETLKAEKQRMIKRMKEDAERIKEMNAANDREIQALRRSEKAALDGRKKAEREIELQLQQQQRTAAMLHRSSGAASTAQQANKSNKAVIGFLKKPQTPKGITKTPKRGAPRMSNGSEHKESNIPKPQAKTPRSTRLQVSQKKQVIDRAIYGYISGQHAINVMEDMLKKRERLRTEKIELEQERQRVVQAQEENALANGSEMLDFASEPQYMDDRLTMIDAEITYINARIRALQAEAAALGFVTSIEKGLHHHDESRDGSTTDEEELMTKLIRQGMAEDAMGLPPGSGATVAFESSINILRSMDLNESREFLEMLFEDMVAVRSHENGLQVQVANQEKVIEELKRALQAMRRAAVGATLGYEKRCDGLEQKLRQLRGSSEQLDLMVKAQVDGSSEEDENDAEVARLNRAMIENSETKSPSPTSDDSNGLLSASDDQLWTALPSTARPRPGSAAEAALDVKAKRASTIFDQMYEDAMKTSDEVSPKVGGSAGEFSRILMTNNERRVSWVGVPNADTAEYLGINQEKEQLPQQQQQQHNPRLARSSSTSNIVHHRSSNPEREHAPKPRENMSMYGHRRGSSTAGGSGSGHSLGIGANGPPTPGLHRSSSSMNRLTDNSQHRGIYASTASSRQHAEVTAARRSSTPVSMPSVGPKSASRPRFNSNSGHFSGNAEQNGLPSPGFHGRTPLTIQTGFANGYSTQQQTLRHSKSHHLPLNQSIHNNNQNNQQQQQQRQNFDSRRTSTPSPALIGKRFSRPDLNGDSLAQGAAIPGTPQARPFNGNNGRPLSRIGSMNTTTPTATHMMGGPLPSPGLHGAESHYGFQQESQYHTHHHNNSASRRISGSWDDNQNVYERLASVHTQASQARLLATRSGGNGYASQASAPAGGSMMTSGMQSQVGSFQMLQHRGSASRLMHRPSVDGLNMAGGGGGGHDGEEGGGEHQERDHWSSNSSSSAVSTSSTNTSSLTPATNSPTMQESPAESSSMHQAMLGKAEVVPVF